MYKIIVVFLAVLVFASCKKDLKIENEDSRFNFFSAVAPMNYYTTNGIIRVQAQKGIGASASLAVDGGYSVLGYIKDDNSKVIAAGDLSLNQLVLQQDSADSTYYTGSDFSSAKVLYGTMVKVNVKSINNQNLLLDSFYLPQSFYLEKTTGNTIKEGALLKWNADLENKNGVVISIKYDPEFLNDDFKNAGFTNKVSNGVVVNDNGSVKLDKSLFNKIPEGARVSILAGRGNSKVAATDEGEKISIGGYTSVIGMFIYE